jgi:hypothetical protein
MAYWLRLSKKALTPPAQFFTADPILKKLVDSLPPPVVKQK